MSDYAGTCEGCGIIVGGDRAQMDWWRASHERFCGPVAVEEVPEPQRDPQ